MEYQIPEPEISGFMKSLHAAPSMNGVCSDIIQAYNLFCAGIPAEVGGIVSMSQGANCLVIYTIDDEKYNRYFHAVMRIIEDEEEGD